LVESEIGLDVMALAEVAQVTVQETLEETGLLVY